MVASRRLADRTHLKGLAALGLLTGSVADMVEADIGALIMPPVAQEPAPQPRFERNARNVAIFSCRMVRQGRHHSHAPEPAAQVDAAPWDHAPAGAAHLPSRTTSCICAGCMSRKK